MVYFMVILEFLAKEATMPKMYLPCYKLLYWQGMVSTIPAMVFSMPASPLCGETGKSRKIQYGI